MSSQKVVAAAGRGSKDRYWPDASAFRCHAVEEGSTVSESR